ncbi:MULTISPECIES: phiSA1p31-related protein [unclassified Streptomyces]|uniref:phiSA1p31-related protein n=1 Tax=unclassified Streptomyces TaxID=2593676 RepID=UPI0003754980|nr:MULTISPECIES: phiSA1p31-related protein [unclassified Streptomyces]MYY03090.1 hypothetical protein [Streptomyces sp. SID4913]
MAEAQYETRTRTVEETFVVLRLTEDEAEELAGRLLYDAADSDCMQRLLEALRHPVSPAPPADTFEYGGVMYDLSAKYRDTEADVWSFTGRRDPEGIPYVTMYEGSNNTADTIVSVNRGWGPLTKVVDA